MNLYATGSTLEDGLVKIWSTDSGKCIASAKTHADITGLQWIDHEHLLVSIAFKELNPSASNEHNINSSAGGVSKKVYPKIHVYKFIRNPEVYDQHYENYGPILIKVHQFFNTPCTVVDIKMNMGKT